MTDCLSNRHNQPASLTKPTQKAFLQKATFCLARDQVASSRLRAGPCQGFISKGHRELRGRGRVTGWAQGDWTPHCPEGPAGGCLPGSEGPQLGLPVVEHVLRALTTLLWVRPERSPTLKCEGGRKESGGRVPGHPKSGRHATGLAEGAAPSAHAPSASLGGFRLTSPHALPWGVLSRYTWNCPTLLAQRCVSQTLPAWRAASSEQTHRPFSMFAELCREGRGRGQGATRELSPPTGPSAPPALCQKQV